MDRRGLGTLLAVLPVALAPVPAFVQIDPGYEAVPAANLSEGTLSVPEENFSIRAPGPHWDWLRDTPAKDATVRNYLCRNLRTGERFLLTVGRSSEGSAEKHAESLLAGIKAAQEAQGRELVGERSDPSDVPAPGSRRLSTMITGPGTTIYFTGYVLGADRTYTLQHYSEAPKESPAFQAFARSFALLEPDAAASARYPLGGVGAILVVASVLAVVLVAARALGRYAKKRPGSRG
jgi:hypothetical protein